MKAADRCKEHFQGDRCQKAKHHDYATAVKQDLLHVGDFSAWKGTGDSKKLMATTQGARIPVKRHRQLNRYIRRMKTGKEFAASLMPGAEFKNAKKILEFAFKHFRGKA